MSANKRPRLMTSHASGALAAALRAAGHPARLRALDEFYEADLSPVELQRLVVDPALTLGVLSYHVRTLARAGLLELCETIPRRGAIEHRYTLTPRGRVLARAVRKLAAEYARQTPS